MKHTMTLKMATCVVAVIGLSGCQSVLNTLGLNSSASSRPALANAIGEPDLVAGQEALRAGNISQAIASFRLAMLDPGSQADASNGLGIAYARLGRADLAERYFLQATEIAPKGEKYAANLMRFYESDLARTAQAKALRLQQAALARADDQSTNGLADLGTDQPAATRGPILVVDRRDEGSLVGGAKMANQQTRPARGVIQLVQRGAGTGDIAHSAPEKLIGSVSSDQTAIIVGSRNTAKYPVKLGINEMKGSAPKADPKLADARSEMASRSKTIWPSYPIRFEIKANGASR
jgi:tetratricopeptide (TPR) repeat protein